MAQLDQLGVSARFENGMSAGAKAAAADMERLAKAGADVDGALAKTSERVTRVGATAEQLARKFLEAERATARLAAANRATAGAMRDNDALLQAGRISLERHAEIQAGILARQAADQEKYNRSIATAAASSAAGMAAQAAEMERLRTRYDPLYVAAQRYESALQDIARAEQAGILSTRTAAQARADATAQMHGFANAAAQATREQQNAAAAQAEFNRVLQVGGSGSDHASRAADVAAYGNELDRLRAKYNPLFAVSKQYEATLEEIAHAERVGAISTREAAAARERATASFAAATAPVQRQTQQAEATVRSLRLQAHEATNLSYQIQDVFVQLAGGQNPFLIMAQQGPQATGAVGGVRRGLELLSAAITPVRAATIALTAAAAATALAYNAQEGSLVRVQTRMRATTTDYVAMGRVMEAQARRAAATVPGLSTASARNAMVSFAGAAPRNSGFDFADITRQAADFARVMGTDVDAAVGRFTEGMRDPVGLVDSLAKQGFPGMTESLRLTALRLAEGGQRGDAFTLVLGRIAAATSGAARTGMSPLESGLDRLSKRFRDMWGVVAEGLAGAGADFLDWLERSNGRVENGGIFDPSLGNSTGLSRMLFGHPAQRTDPAAVPANMQPVIAQAAGQAGVDAALLARVMTLGERSRQNADGTWPTSPKGAEGPLQVMPGTFAEMARRYNISGGINDPQANATAGAYYLREMLNAFNGDVKLALAAYNAGPGRVNEVLAGRAELPRETVGYVRRAAAGYSGTGLGPTAPRPGIAFPTGLDMSGADAGRSIQDAVLAPAALERLLRQARGAEPLPGQSGTLANRRAGLITTIGQAQDARLLGATAEEQETLTAAVQRWRAELEAAKTPHEAMLQRLQQQNASAQETNPTLRAMADAMAEYDQAIRAAGQTPDPAERQRYMGEVLRGLRGPVSQAIADTRQQVEAEQALANATMEGAAAVSRAENLNRALDLARRSGYATATAESDIVKALARGYDDLTAAQQRRVSAQSLQGQNNQIEYLTAERGLRGLSSRERALEQAALRQRLAIQNRGGDPDSGRSELEILNARTIAGMEYDAGRVGDAFESAFGKATSQVEDFLVTGGKASDLLKAMEQDLARLAYRALLMNPLEKAASGVLGQAGNWLTSLFGPTTITGVNPAAGTYGASPNEMALGGIMTSAGAAPLQRYAEGGVAYSPQIALFGEARKPEAYVPLNDGRSIPVTVQGGTGGGLSISQTFRIDARGADAGAAIRMEAVARRVAREQQNQLIAQVGRGGAMAKAMGRR
ncbi:phage tail length tape measure family protein [Pseudoroseomonas cervicalis]|uniref:phage tail length tape measure family protein n=1 Tax=Teichococcus cervicalis TaxID=204525 RepID=UPI002783F23F|nr:phage tail length tape measure family protein [Pseudoroseomonas cervicalis]MDQ1081450.1 hypothetical protein [Pseudoroseomonas cervicalis]